MAHKNETPVLVLSLLVTLGLLGGGVWWFTRQAFHGKTSTATSTEPSSPLAAHPPQQGSATFADVQAVPSGLFNYGGSTTWAPIRGQVDTEIQKAWPSFRLVYTNPVSEPPGSTTGIRMLLNNQLAFAQSSRSLKPEEYQEAKTRGFNLNEIPVALEGIAIAVNPNLNIPGLTVEQLKGIYTGQISNWSQVGGPNVAIVPYSRPAEDSGTVEFFVENVLGGSKFSNTVKTIGTTTQAIRELSINSGGIYYASAPEIISQCTIKPLPVGRSSNQLIAPYQQPFVPASQCPAQRNQIDAAALQTGQYPLTRRLFVVVKQNGQGDQQAGEAYAKLLLTDQGQNLLTQAGFVRIR
jgi:phosphate transport system substrate-binding protein